MMGRLLLKALRTGLWGLLIGPLAAVILVFGAMIFDPKCGAGDSGGCAMGLVTAPIAVALPSFGLFFVGGLLTASGSDALRTRPPRSGGSATGAARSKTSIAGWRAARRGGETGKKWRARLDSNQRPAA